MPQVLKLRNAGAGRNQALRTALSLSMITGRPFEFFDAVDDGQHPKPGLGPGGFTAVKAAAAVSGAVYEARLGNPDGSFRPREIRPDAYVFDVSAQRKSAAAVTPIMLCLLPALALAAGDSSLVVNGGTHVHAAPTSDEMRYVLAPTMSWLGLPVSCSEIAPGFLPLGGGEAEMQVKGPAFIRSLQAQGSFMARKVGLEIVSSGLPVHLAEMAMQGAQDRLALKGVRAEGRIRRARGGHGLSVLAWAQSAEGLRVGFSALGHRGGRPEAVAVEAVEGLLTFLQSGVGLPARMAGDLLTILACAEGVSRLSLPSLPTALKASAKVIEAFWPGSLQLLEPRFDKPAEIRVIGQDFGRQA